jgi:hypothetical protein
MMKPAKTGFILSLISVFVLGLGSSQASAVQVGRQVLDGGGAMRLCTDNCRLSSSLGQSIIGVQVGATNTLYTGFWNPWVGDMTPVEWEEDHVLLPKEFDLRQNYPNPFNPTTVIEYALPKACQVRIQIFNILGQRVRNLVDEPQKAGYKTIHWDGKDDFGNQVSSGVYFCSIAAGDYVECKKMALLK